MSFVPTREAALRRLDAFVREGALRYADRRNLDPGPDADGGVARLSPWIRRRLITEAEVCARVLAAHPLPRVDKFVQEVCWRTYWKGWLQQRPEIWTRWQAQCAHDHAQLEADGALRRRYRQALDARTGIDGFDAWRTELADTGHLHNHARMWFASIWIFTLRLPWALGAELFLNELLDGDPASNTLSWRWIAGLHTRGKHYLARAENIERYTAHRHHPRGQLDEHAAPLPMDAEAPRIPLPAIVTPDASQPAVLVLHEDDLHAASLPLPAPDRLRGVAVLARAADCGAMRDPRSARVQAFVQAALHDAAQHASAACGVTAEVLGPHELVRWARDRGAQRLWLPFAPVGDEAGRIAGLQALAHSRGLSCDTLWRDWDRAFWPHAARGFFQLRSRIPEVLAQLGIG